MTCCLLEKAEREWGAPPSRAIRTPRIFPRIFCAFLRDSGTPIFQAPKRRRKICGKWARKWAQKSAHPKICAKRGAKICAPKMAQKRAQKWAEKSAHRKSAQKTGLNIPFVWKMEARKKTKNNLRQTCAKPQPQETSQVISTALLLNELSEKSGEI